MRATTIAAEKAVLRHRLLLNRHPVILNQRPPKVRRSKWSDYGKCKRENRSQCSFSRQASRFVCSPPISPENTRTIPQMGFRFHRSIRILPGVRLNFGKRGVSTSVGVRGAHVTFGKAGTRTTVGLPGSGLSYTHLEKPHRDIPAIPKTADPLSDPTASPGSAQRGILWMGLLVIAIIVVIGRMTSPAPAQVSTPPQTVVQIAARAAQAADDEKLADTRRAALGIVQVRHAVASSNTLKLSRVVVMQDGTICYRVHLRNSRGVAYVRTAVMEGAELKVSDSDGFSAHWNRLCAHQSGGRDITSDVEKVIRLPTR